MKLPFLRSKGPISAVSYGSLSQAVCIFGICKKIFSVNHSKNFKTTIGFGVKICIEIPAELFTSCVLFRPCSLYVYNRDDQPRDGTNVKNCGSKCAGT